MWQGARSSKVDLGEGGNRPREVDSVEDNLGDFERRGSLRRAWPTGRR